MPELYHLRSEDFKMLAEQKFGRRYMIDCARTLFGTEDRRAVEHLANWFGQDLPESQIQGLATLLGCTVSELADQVSPLAQEEKMQRELAANLFILQMEGEQGFWPVDLRGEGVFEMPPHIAAECANNGAWRAQRHLAAIRLDALLKPAVHPQQARADAYKLIEERSSRPSSFEIAESGEKIADVRRRVSVEKRGQL